MMYVIYSIKCKATGREYIGKTKNLEERIKQHLKYANNPNLEMSHRPLYVDIRNNGFKQFYVEIIENDNINNIDAGLLEKKYITERNPYYNGIGGGGGSLSVDVDKVIELYNTHKNIKEVSRITGYDPSTVSSYLKRNNIEVDLTLIHESYKKKIQSYNLDTGETIKTYDSVTHASMDLTGKPTGKSAINKVATGRNYSYKKMGWRYI